MFSVIPEAGRPETIRVTSAGLPEMPKSCSRFSFCNAICDGFGVSAFQHGRLGKIVLRAITTGLAWPD